MLLSTPVLNYLSETPTVAFIACKSINTLLYMYINYFRYTAAHKFPLLCYLRR